MPVLGRVDSRSALGDTTSEEEARRFDATRDGVVVDRHGHTAAQRRAALALARAADDRAELHRFLQMCGLTAEQVQPIR